MILKKGMEYCMKIVTLGTSHGAAEKGRACSGTLLLVNDSAYLLDCGGNVESKMIDMGLTIEDIKGIFISHMHEDHAGSLSSILKHFTDYIKTEKDVKIYMPEEKGTVAFKDWLEALHFPVPRMGRLVFRLIHEGEIYRDDNISVSAIPTQHIKGASFAFVIRISDKSILYTGDLSGDFHDYPNIAFEEDFNAVICELVHFDIEKNLETIAKSKTQKLIFTHILPYNIKKIKNNEEKFPFSVYIAEDNMMFEI